jgi:hypothetical protein
MSLQDVPKEAAGEVEQREAKYDADAEQRAPFQTERKGKLYSVVHVFGPITDEAVIQYERGRDQRISDAETGESNEQDAMAVTSRSFQAAIAYWDSTGTRAEGYAGEVSAKDKAFAVQNILFAVEFDALSLAAADELCPDDEDDDTSTYKLRCMFDGRLLTTEHTLRAGTADEVAEFQSMMSRALLVRGTHFGQTDQRIPSKARRLGVLYDKVKVTSAGYAGRVPIHHKMAVVLRHFRAQQKATAGN